MLRISILSLIISFTLHVTADISDIINLSLAMERGIDCISENEPLEETSNSVERCATDLIFTKSGVRKSVIKYRAVKGYCRKCQRSFHTPFTERGRPDLYGRGYKVWVIYQRLSHRMSYRSISQITEDLFGENLERHFMIRTIQEMAFYYSETENRFYALGKTDLKRTLFIVITVRNKLIRVISARDMSRKEREVYNNE